jgi:PAS domain-containing protein
LHSRKDGGRDCEDIFQIVYAYFTKSINMETQRTPLQMLYDDTAPVGDMSDKISPDNPNFEDEKRMKIKEERNVREQRRANKINEQIEMLRSLLQDADFPVQTASKYNVLYNCERYIKELIDKAANLADVDNMMNRNSSMHSVPSLSILKPSPSLTSELDDFMHEEFRPDYEKVIETADLPIAIASADGQLIRANKSFFEMIEYDPEQLDKLTIFSFAVPEFRKQLFEAVGESIVSVLSTKRVPAHPKIVPIQSKSQKRLLMNISAVPQSSTSNVFSVPKNFLCCAILPELHTPGPALLEPTGRQF